MGFIFNGAAVQHRALLQRQMRFGSLAVIDTVALVMTITTGVSMALTGFGYWSVVIMTLGPQAIGGVGSWIAAGWLPGKPRSHSGVGPLLRFGGTLTLNSLIVHLAYNMDKVLLGRFWGAEALGVYSRAYQLLNLPLDGISSAISQVALPALARVQNEAARLRRQFLHGYGAFLALLVPLTVACAFFSQDIVRVFLGTRWAGAAHVFQFLTPTMLVMAFINPLSWLMLATGRAPRSLGIAVAIAPTVILGYSLGLPHGPEGVAMGFSGAMLLLAVPVVVWARHGTALTTLDVAREAMPSVLSAGIASVTVAVMAPYVGAIQPTLLRLIVESTILFGIFSVAMLFVMKDKAIYWNMLRDADLV
jgi:PST family polysaccharide transporter